MEENNFERRVRQEMSDLKIDPSDAVWEQVRLRIEKKKNRRRGFLIFFLLGALLLGGSYVMLYSPARLSTSETIFNFPLKEKTTKESMQAKDPETKSPVNERYKPVKEISALNNEKVKPVNGIAEQQKTIIYYKFKKTTAKPGITGNVFFVRGIANNEKQNLARKNSQLKPQSLLSQDEEKNTGDVHTPIVADATIEANNVFNIDSSLALADPFSIKDISIIVNPKDKLYDSLKLFTKAKKQAKPASKNKWHVGLNVAGGLSYIGSHFLSNILSAEKSLGQDYLSSVQNNNPGTNGYYTIIPPPSEVKRSGAFVIGLFLQKEFSAKTIFSTGLNYQKFTVSNPVGNLNNSTQRFSSRSADKRYRNTFSFIEMPLEVKVGLSKGKKMPVYWHGGISLSALIGSNALQYKGDSLGSYYVDNTLLKKVQFGFSTGLSVNLFNIKNNPVTIGPYLYYDVSGVAKEGLYNKQHFIFTGLRTQLLFKRK